MNTLSDEQRRQTGWIGVQKCEVILKRALSLATVILTSCAMTKGAWDSVFEDDPPTLSARLEASTELNPDYEGKPSPLVVRLYELTDITEFNAAQFFSLYDEDQELLKLYLKTREETVILPGEIRKFERELHIETRYVGILGAYREVENAKWRAFVETPVDETTAVRIIFGKTGISIPQEEP